MRYVWQLLGLSLLVAFCGMGILMVGMWWWSGNVEWWNSPVTASVTATPQGVAPATVAPRPHPTPTSRSVATPPYSQPTPRPTATPVPSVLRVTPLAEHVACDNHHYQLITITNTGAVDESWVAPSSDPPQLVADPSNSTEAGTTSMPPGMSEKTIPYGTAPPGTVWTISVYQTVNNAAGPLAGVVTITCH